ncbi:DNA topoisomerase IB [soil metagenome]
MTLDASLLDPHVSARAAHCRYVDDGSPGIKRLRSGRGFTYVAVDGHRIRDAASLKRFRRLVIPPAWTNVWICPSVDGHIQVTGRDARGRKQYRYHPRFREVRDETKYARMIEFASALPSIRARIDQDLSRAGVSRERVLATVVRLLEITLIRIGNEEYARDNGSFGLTTMRSRHVDVEGSTITFSFRGKSGKSHVVKVSDRRVAKIVARCHDLPGEVLFQYDDEGLRAIESSDVNDYLRAVSGDAFTAKDFRTWAGTVLAAEALAPLAEVSQKGIATAVKAVAGRLGNTPAVCRRCYIHPEVFESFADGSLGPALNVRAVDEAPPTASLSALERAVLRLLQKRTSRPRGGAASRESRRAA